MVQPQRLNLERQQMSSLLDTLADPQYVPKRGPSCTVHLAMQDMDKDTLNKFTTAMANTSAAGTLIAEALQDLGYKVRADAIQRHRRGACRCGIS
jgi:hypothetical protein